MTNLPPTPRPITPGVKNRPIWYHLHFWIGWIAAIPIVVVCVTGALLTFQKSIFQWEHAELFHLEVTDSPLSVQQVLDRYRAATPPLEVNHLEFPEGPEQSYSAYVTELRPEGNRPGRVFLNPYTGTLTSLQDEFSIVETLIQLHRRLTAGRSGQMLVGASSLVLILTGMLGVILWWPLRGKTFVRAWRRGQALDWHNALGLVVLLPLLVMAVTGVTFTWGPNVWMLMERLRGPKPVAVIQTQESVPISSALTRDSVPSMDLIVERIRSELPSRQITGIQPGNGGQTPVKVFLAGDEGPLQLEIDPSTGMEISRSDGSATGLLDWYRRKFGAIDTMGPFGLIVRVVWALISLSGAVLVGTGLWISVKRWRRPQSPRVA